MYTEIRQDKQQKLMPNLMCSFKPLLMLQDLIIVVNHCIMMIMFMRFSSRQAQTETSAAQPQ